MKIAELYRRGVVVPLGREAADRMASGDVDKTTPVQFVPIPDQEDFEELQASGLFEAINQRLDCCIDDSRAELVEPRLVPALKEVLIAFAKNSEGNTGQFRFLRDILELCNVAASEQVPIYFIL